MNTEIPKEKLQKLQNYHIDELENTFSEIYDSAEYIDNLDERLATSVAVTLRTVGYPVTLREIAVDFGVELDKLRTRVEELKEKRSINKNIENTYEKEQRMVLVNNLDYSFEVREAFNKLFDEVYKEKIGEKDEYSTETVLSTCMWMASRLSAIDSDSMSPAVGEIYENVSENDVVNCYLDVFVDNDYKVNHKLMDDKGIMDSVDEYSDKIGLSDAELKYISTQAHKYEQHAEEYDNKTVAMIMVSNVTNYKIEELQYGTNSSKIKRIKEQIKTDKQQK